MHGWAWRQALCVFMPSRGPPCAGSASLGARDAREAKQGGRESNLGKAEAAKSAMPSRAGTMSQSAERETWRLRAGHASTARQRACRARKACVLDFWRLWWTEDTQAKASGGSRVSGEVRGHRLQCLSNLQVVPSVSPTFFSLLTHMPTLSGISLLLPTFFSPYADPFGYPIPQAKQPLAISPLFLAPPTPFSYLHDNKAFSQHAVKGGGLAMSRGPIFPYLRANPVFWHSV